MPTESQRLHRSLGPLLYRQEEPSSFRDRRVRSAAQVQLSLSRIRPWSPVRSVGRRTTVQRTSLLTRKSACQLTVQINDQPVLLLIIYDCLRILKNLGKNQPYQEIFFGVNNLFLRDGRLRMLDPFLSRQNLVKELTKINKEKLNRKARE